MNKGDFSTDWLRELKQKNDLVSTIQGYIPLTYKGGQYWGCCPFHHEKTPSFAVNQREGYFHCFGCNVSGDVISFVQKMEDITFPEAVKILAEKAGMEVPNVKESERTAEIKKKRDRLFALMKDAALRYHENLKDEHVGAKARSYLAARGIRADIIVKFGLGYSADYDDLINYLKRKGYTEQEMTEAAVAQRNSSGSVYDPQAGRFVTPIIDRFGRVIAFGGRILENRKDIAKYRNSSNSLIFEKSKTVFGINLAKSVKQQEGLKDVILVEGYMDVISLASAGITNAVAGMGTALTEGQARLIKYLTDKVYVCYDGDNAGREAALRNIDILEKEGLEVQVVSLPDGQDPDDFIKKHGITGFNKLLDEARPLIEYKLHVAESGLKMNTPDGRAKYVARAIAVLKSVSDTARREVYFEWVSDRGKISVETVRKYFSGELGLITEERAADKPSAERGAVDKSEQANVAAAEFVLFSLLKGKSFANIADLKEEYFFTDVQHDVWAYIKDCAAKGAKPIIGSLFETMEDSPELSSLLSNGVSFAEEARMQKYFSDCVARLKRKYADARIAELLKGFESASDEQRVKILTEVKNLKAQLAVKS